MRKIVYSVVITFLIFVGFAVNMVAHAEEGYCNGSDTYSDGAVELFSNSEDEDKLYKLNLLDMSEEKVLDLHVISMLHKGSDIYLLVYIDGKSNLLKFNIQNYSYSTVMEFDTIVTNIALRDNKLYYLDSRNILTYNFENGETAMFIENGDVDLLLFTDYNTLKYYEPFPKK